MSDSFNFRCAQLRILLLLRGFAFAIALIGLAGCDAIFGPVVRGSGVIKAETREVGTFTRVESSGSANVTIQIGEKQSVIVETDENVVPLIETAVSGDALRVSSHGRYSTHKGVKVTIVVPRLHEVRITGSGNINASGVSSKEFDASISGSGDINISGSTESLKASVTGSGGIDASELPSAAADVHISGSGNVKVAARESLQATITGSGDVRYAGTPKLETHVSGSGRVRSM